MTTPVQVLKFDDDRHLVFGWANVAISKSGTQVTDSHDHQIDPSELEHAAYQFNLSYREMDEMHTEPVTGRLVESFFVTPEKLEKMGLPADALPQGWWVGFHVDDEEVWQKIKKGDYRMFSIAGTAVIEEA